VRVQVNENLCQGHTLCHMTAPEIFQLRDEDGHAYVTHDLVPPELEDSAVAAEATCPEGAIRLIE
jgi:ferredoxin